MSHSHQPTPLRVVLIDDDILVRYALRYLFRTEPGLQIVAESEDGNGIIQVIENYKPDILVVDVHLKPLNGIAICANVRRRFPEIRIVLMSSFHDDDFETHAQNAGANAFFAKTDAADRICFAVRGNVLPREVSQRALSNREFAIAELASRGYTNDQIAQELHLSTNTVKTYLSRIFKKIGARNRVDLTNYVRGTGDESSRITPDTGPQGVGGVA